MEKQQSEKMKHMSFVLPKEEREAFRYLCFVWEMTPSEALRSMVRIAIGGGYHEEAIKQGGKR